MTVAREMPPGPGRRPQRRLTRARLRTLCIALFVALALPSAALVWLGFRQLDLGSLRQQQLAAEAFAAQVDSRLAAAIVREAARPVSDYVHAAEADGGLVERSPLASLESRSDLPGLIGYFRVDADGVLSTPLLPAGGDLARYGLVDADDVAARRAVAARLAAVLADNRLVDPAAVPEGRSPAPAATDSAAASSRQRLESGQAAFDRLADSAGSFESQAIGELAAEPLALEERSEAFATTVQPPEPDLQSTASTPARAAPAAIRETGKSASGETMADAVDDTRDADAVLRVSAFSGDVEPLVFSTLDTGHFVLFRNAWRGGRREVQGMLLDDSAFLAGALHAPFAAAGFADGIVLRTVVAGASREAAAVSTRSILRTRLSPPLAAITLEFDAAALPPSPLRSLLVWSAIALFVILTGGMYAIWRFGAGQIALAEQQRTFVSAVTHELKTPLTSIRMYGEMLRAGWASDAKKREYYDFIHIESERLSRLIDNVLMLARIERGGAPVLDICSVGEALDLVRSKVAGAVEQAGFALAVHADADVAALPIRIDPDGFAQIFINLIDNAIKYSSAAGTREIEVSARRGGDDRVVFRVRDFGPGFGERDMRRLFELFYRPDTSLTRSVAGTGIGLALVRALALQIGGRVDAVNAAPGAAVSLSLPVAHR